MELKIIGKVNNEDGFTIIIKEQIKEALEGLDGFSHLVVLWWADQVDDPEFRNILTTEKPYKNGPDNIGILATRSPLRPNPICMSIIDVQSIDYEKGIIYTSYIDADEGTSVLDIKPYYPCSDIVRDVGLPNWCDDLPRCIEDSADFDWSNHFNF